MFARHGGPRVSVLKKINHVLGHIRQIKRVLQKEREKDLKVKEKTKEKARVKIPIYRTKKEVLPTQVLMVVVEAGQQVN